MSRRLTSLAALLFAAALPLSAQAGALTGCAAADLSGLASNGFACAGFASGNLLSNKKSDVDATKALLAQLGLSNYNGTWLEKIELGGGSNVDFTTHLSGTTWVGIHTGKSNDGSQGTAFYRFEAGTDLDSFKFLLSGSSGAVLFATQPVPLSDSSAVSADVPEPESLALMVAALAAMGVTLRSRRKTSR